MVSMSAAADIRPPVGTPVARGRSLPSGGSDQELSDDRPEAMGLAAERQRLERLGLSQDVVRTIQSARAASTRASYTAKWTAFQRWCVEKALDPTACSLPHILSFLQLLVDRNLAFSTVKTYAAAISSLAPQWDLALVLRALIKAPFEPLDQVSLKFLSVKTALLLALTS